MSEDTAKKIYRMQKASKGIDPDSKEFMSGFYNIQDKIERSDFPNLNLAAIVGYFDSAYKYFGDSAKCLTDAADILLKIFPALKGKRADQTVEVLKRQPENVQVTQTLTEQVKTKLPKIKKPTEGQEFSE